MAAFAVAAMVALGFPQRAAGETLYGVTLFNELITFDSDTPGTILSTTPITGLQMFESVVGMDFRPATGGLYALGNAPGSIYHLYSMNIGTGAVSQIGSNLSFSGSAVAFGFDFNPVTDTIRVVNNATQNGRLDPTTGAYTADTALTWSFATPSVVGAAHSNNYAGAVTTTLFDMNMDSVTMFADLLIQEPPNSGVLGYGPITGAPNIPYTNILGFDISGSTGTAYVGAGDPNTFTSQLYTVSTDTGNATLVGEIGSGIVVRGLSALITVPEMSTLTSLGIAALAGLLLRLRSKKS